MRTIEDVYNDYLHAFGVSEDEARTREEIRLAIHVADLTDDNFWNILRDEWACGDNDVRGPFTWAEDKLNEKYHQRAAELGLPVPTGRSAMEKLVTRFIADGQNVEQEKGHE